MTGSSLVVSLSAGLPTEADPGVLACCAQWELWVYHDFLRYGGFHKWGYPKIDGLQGKILLKWMIWGYPIYGHPHTINDIVYDHTMLIQSNLHISLFYNDLTWQKSAGGGV